MSSIFRNSIRGNKQKALREHLNSISKDHTLDLFENHSRTEIKQVFIFFIEAQNKEKKVMKSNERVSDIS